MARKKDFNYVSGKKYDGMLGRCYRPTDRSYANYGGRGVKVCSNWIKNINNFRTWLLGELAVIGVTIEDFIKDSRNIQLDRIDVDGHYTPDNCRLVNNQTNVRNRRCGVLRTVTSAEGETIKLG